MTEIIVSELAIYPIKSCRGISEQETQIGAFGLKNDRRWMVVDEQGIMLTQRKISKMCLIQPALVSDGVILKILSMHELYVKTPSNTKKIKVKVWADECTAFDAGDSAAKWLSDFLEIKCRLVYFPDDEFRQVDLNFSHVGDKTAFSDGFPLLLISQESLDDLNTRIATNVISMDRFRPNIVVKGASAFAEDEWKKIKIGDTTLRIVKPCSRCVIPSINIETAEREKEPLKTLVSYRKRDNKIYFGQNVIANSVGNIKVGMSVELID